MKFWKSIKLSIKCLQFIVCLTKNHQHRTNFMYFFNINSWPLICCSLTALTWRSQKISASVNTTQTSSNYPFTIFKILIFFSTRYIQSKFKIQNNYKKYRYFYQHPDTVKLGDIHPEHYCEANAKKLPKTWVSTYKKPAPYDPYETTSGSDHNLAAVANAENVARHPRNNGTNFVLKCLQRLNPHAASHAFVSNFGCSKSWVQFQNSIWYILPCNHFVVFSGECAKIMNANWRNMQLRQ